MTVDYQVLFPQEVIRLNSLKMIAAADAPVLEVTGQDFSAVDEVLINEQPSPFVEILGDKKLTAQVPSFIAASEINSVNVVSRRLTFTDTSLLRFKISECPAKCSGIMKLMQLYVKLLLTTPGTDIFHPTIGGGILKILGSNVSSLEGQGVINQFVIASDSVVRQIISIQGRQPRLSVEEKLLSANILSAKFSAAQAALFVVVELNSQAGRTAKANMVV